MSLIRCLCLTLCCALSLSTFAAPLKEIPIFPKGAPGEKGDIGEEKEQPAQPKNPAKRITNVTNPTVTVFPASADKATGAAVLICPGGGYGQLAFDKEGTEIAEWLNSIGVTGVVLKYRVPRRKGLEKHTAPLQDAQRAMGIVRQHAKEWNIDTKRIGVLGFSAGGHLAAVLSNNYEKRTYEAIDEADQLSCRPDFAMMIYPAYLTVKEEGDKVAPELPITKNTPPSFLVQTEDDGVRVESSLFYYLALKNAKVPVEMHLYPKGGHGYGMRPSESLVSTWPDRATQWMKSSGLLEKK
jgi:acetyl esterase/lipase